MVTRIGYARVSLPGAVDRPAGFGTPATGCALDGLHAARRVSGAQSSRPEFDRALEALHEGGTLVITTLSPRPLAQQNSAGQTLGAFPFERTVCSVYESADFMAWYLSKR